LKEKKHTNKKWGWKIGIHGQYEIEWM